MKFPKFRVIPKIENYKQEQNSQDLENILNFYFEKKRILKKIDGIYCVIHVPFQKLDSKIKNEIKNKVLPDV